MLHKFFRRRVHEYMIFAWISCIRHTLPGATLDTACKTFRKRFGIKEEEISDKTIIKIWDRMNKEYDDAEVKTKAEATA